MTPRTSSLMFASALCFAVALSCGDDGDSATDDGGDSGGGSGGTTSGSGGSAGSGGSSGGGGSGATGGSTNGGNAGTSQGGTDSGGTDSGGIGPGGMGPGGSGGLPRCANGVTTGRPCTLDDADCLNFGGDYCFCTTDETWQCGNI